MTTENKLISATRINRLKAQGYFQYSDEEVSSFAFGNRFALALCATFIFIGVATINFPILLAMTLVAIGGFILPYHPFDYIYNHLLRGVLNKPELPRRSKQLKFACKRATMWLIVTISLFYMGFEIAGYVFGGMLFSAAFLVSTTDFCIPSTIYNYKVRKLKEKAKTAEI